MSQSKRPSHDDSRQRLHARLDEWSARLDLAERSLRAARTGAGAGAGARQASSNRPEALATRLTMANDETAGVQDERRG